jgi:hypothetical protein
VAAFAVFARAEQMPKGTSPFADLGENRFACLFDKDDTDDVLALSLTYRIARHWALADAVAEGDELDVRAMQDALEHARHQLQSFTLLKRKVTQLESSLADGVAGIRDELDRARLALTDALDRLDAAVQAGDDGAASEAA